jgi:hypothetical protein
MTRLRLYPSCCSAALLLLAFGTTAGATDGAGSPDLDPLPLHTDFVLGAGFLTPGLLAGTVMPSGSLRWSVTLSAANTFALSRSLQAILDHRSRGPVSLEALDSLAAEEPLFLADGELYRTTLAVRYGVRRGLELELSVPLLEVRGGFADPLIEDFHDLVGLPQNGRSGARRDVYLAYLRTPEGERYARNRSPGGGVGDVAIGVRTRLPGPTGLDLALRGLLELPTGDARTLRGSGAVDFALQLAVSRRGRRSALHACLGASRLGGSSVLEVDAEVALMAGLSWHRYLGGGFAALVQLRASQSPFRGLGIQRLSQPTVLGDVGFSRRLGARGRLFAAFTENLANLNSSPDVGLHLGFERSFR